MPHAAALIACAALTSALVSGCSTATEASDRSAPTTSSTPAGSSTSATAPATRTAQSAAETIKTAIPQITVLIPLTETNDTNHLIGRSNGYRAATVIVDSRTSAACSVAKPGVDCGATIEQWPDAAAAQRRADYVQAMRGDMPRLGQQYSAVKDGLLLRVAGTLQPSAADAYTAAFLG